MISRKFAYISGLMPSALVLVLRPLFRCYFEDRRVYVLAERSIPGIHLEFSVGISKKVNDGRHYI